MFTGLVQSVGQLQHLGPYQLKISCPTPRDSVLKDIELGDSIAVDGVCLTVEKILDKGFVASASPETLAKSTLGKVLDNGKVNLETSLRVGSKIGGHFVTGHVDGLGQLDCAERVANAWEISFRSVSPAAARYIVTKGSIAVNGVSLTVADCSESGDWFSTAVIPVTYAETNLQHLNPGDYVNLEGDVLGKYVEKFARGDRNQPGASVDASSPISVGFLAENGYM
ncbi:MAG: riboflavin synthase [Leptolyngbya foveolarum]|uniref:Riboflavin synthase n=1 Tax=Leptolyngbya foveolarum TaxID=47253 RepID=A0A2W4UGZ5_9CYAN|nr:MAG: riboflavin synthase [Leptolyngbya foveolarum]